MFKEKKNSRKRILISNRTAGCKSFSHSHRSRARVRLSDNKQQVFWEIRRRPQHDKER